MLKIDSIMFYVSNLEKAANFYENALGLKRVWTDEEHGMIGFIFPESDSEIVIHRDSSLPNPCFSFNVANVDEFCEEYQKKGYIIVEKPCEARCGKFAVLEDPDGYKILMIDLTKFGNKPRHDE